MSRTGELSSRVEIQSCSESQNTFGEIIETWQTQATRWASIEAKASKEQPNNEKQLSVNNYLITMRPYGLTSKMRLKHGSDIYEITGILNIGDYDQISTTLTV
jgi:head-tail adaptor